MPEFVRASRITVVPVISAAGETGTPLFVFKGKRMPYRHVVVDGMVRVETYAQCLPRNACVAMREENGGVDSTNFLHWVKEVMQSVADLTANGRDVLLTYDAYSAHMSLAVLLMLHAHRIVVYALSAHSSTKTQPLDVVAFSVLKREISKAIAHTVQSGVHSQLDMFEYCCVLKHAYYKTFTREHIVASFRRAGQWPVDPHRLLSLPCPRDSDALSDICSKDQLIQLLEKKRAEAREEILAANITVLRTGFVDTTRGAVLTSSAALSAAKAKADSDSRKREIERMTAIRHYLRLAAQSRRNKEQCACGAQFVNQRRASQTGMTVRAYTAQLRSMKERRASARLRTAQRMQRQSVARCEQPAPRSTSTVASLELLAELECNAE